MSWLKFEASLPEKPETLAITAAMGWDDPDLTVGKLMRLFRWFDQQTIDGNARGVTPALLDRLIGVSGFAQAVADVGWLVVSETGLTLHNFDRHNGETAKSRALTAKRVSKHRSNAPANAEANAPSVTSPLAREEKSREDKKEEKTPRKRGARTVPEEFTVTEEMRDWAALNAPAADVQRETEKFCDWEFKDSKTDWPKAWRNWLRRASDDAISKASSNTGETLREKRARERVEEMTGGLVSAKPPGQPKQPGVFDVPLAIGMD